MKEELYEAIYTSRYLPIEDRKNKPFQAFLLQLFGANQVAELATICTKDALQTKQERDHANEIKWRDEKIEALTLTNKDLNEEIERLKAALLAEQAAKPVKPQWRPVPATMPVATPREPAKSRATLKPSNVQFGTKPGAS